MKQSVTWENINDSCMTRELTWQVRDPDKNLQTSCKTFVSKFIRFGQKLWFWQISSFQQRYFNQLTSMLISPLLILHLTSSSVLGCNARAAAINSPENCSIACRCNGSNAGICVHSLSGSDDASWLEKRGTCNKAPLKLSSQCVHEAAGNLVITSQSIFTFSLSLFRWVYHLPRGFGRGAFLHLALEKRARGTGFFFWVRKLLLHIVWFLSPIYLFCEMENIEMWLQWNVSTCEMHKYCVGCGSLYFSVKSCRCNGVYGEVLSLNKNSPHLCLLNYCIPWFPVL